jgi:2,4-dienoyl-CoA reductase-like NADH-dependent reductase (Old Yellow Enzyme family)
MSTLFDPIRIGSLELPNRIMRSATAERMADPDGRPRPELTELYRELAQGGVGLIVSGHMYVHSSGKAHPEMTGIHQDDLIPDLAALADVVHGAGGRVAAQINHGGMQCSRQTVAQTIAPSAIDAPFLRQTPRAMSQEEIEEMVEAYGQAARRAQEARFDAVQIHGAHGYLVNQFLSPFTNQRDDAWGGRASQRAAALGGRMRFLGAACAAIRQRVGADYPLLIKLGMMDGVEGGLSPEDGARIVAMLEAMGLDGVEVSGGIGGGEPLNTRTGIRAPEDEAYFRPLARRGRNRTRLPVALVGGLRSRSMMEDVLESGDADVISLSRPLICEPDLPRRLRESQQERSACTSCGRCWPEGPGEGIGCRRRDEA